MDLEQFGRLFRELRQLRGFTQDQVLEKSGVYRDARNLRRLEAGELQPKRPAVKALVVKGLEERRLSVIDQFLELAGYEPLREEEHAALGLAADRIPETLPKNVREAPIGEGRAWAGGSPDLKHSLRIVFVWKVCSLCAAVAAVCASAMLLSPFLIITAFVYASLFAISVLLESAYEFRGVVTGMAAFVSFSLTWVTSVGALWAENAMPNLTGLWIAITLFVLSACSQWLLVRPALSARPNVPAGIQSFTGRTAHLKNTGYFLIFVLSFWAIPVHCIASRSTVSAAHPLSVCPPPVLLWLLLVGYFAFSLPMAHVFLSKIRADRHFDMYTTLYFVRAIVGFGLSVICLIWYSSSLAR